MSEVVDYIHGFPSLTEARESSMPNDLESGVVFFGESASVIKRKYESNPDTNVFNDLDKERLETSCSTFSLTKHVQDNENPHGIVPYQIGLGSVDNTRDKDKPVSKKTQKLIDSHVNNLRNPHSVTREQLGLGNVDNISDLNKPISSTAQEALDKKVNIDDLNRTSKDVTDNIIELLKAKKSFGSHVLAKNPHKITPSDIGLGEVDNTRDSEKPVSKEVQKIIDLKSDVKHSHNIEDLKDLSDFTKKLLASDDETGAVSLLKIKGGDIYNDKDCRIEFAPGEKNAGINIGSVGKDPLKIKTADIWYNKTSKDFKVCIDKKAYSVILNNDDYNKQDSHPLLESLTELDSKPNQVICFSGKDKVSVTTLTPFIKTLLDDATKEGARKTLDAAKSSVVHDYKAPVTLKDSGILSWDAEEGVNARITIKGNRTLGVMTNVLDGESGVLTVTQDEVGGRSLKLNPHYVVVGGKISEVSNQKPGKKSFIRWSYDDSSTNIYCWVSHEP